MATCELIDDKIRVWTEWAEKDLIRQIPGAKYSGDQYWEVPLSWGSCLTLRGVFGQNLRVGPTLSAWAQREHDARVGPANFLRSLTEVSDLPLDQRLYPFQDVGRRFLQFARQAILADEMGTGKSCQTLMTIKADPGMLPALVICPNSVKTHWANESDMWGSGAVPYVIDGPAGKRRKLFEEASEDPRALIIINIEAVRIHSRLAPYGSVRLLRCVECGGPDPDLKVSRCEVHPKELNKISFKTVIVDEAHRIKDAKSKQTRACWAVAHQPSVEWRYALTGTPIADHAGDLWPILHLLSPSEFATRTKYIERYCQLGWNAFGAMEILGLRPDHREEFFGIINPRLRRMPKALVLPWLPDKIWEKREAPMTPKQRKAYDELEDGLVTRLDDGRRIVTTNSLTAQIRLIQLASTYLELQEDGSVKMCEPSPKLDVLEEVAADLEGHQFVVCAESRQLIELAAARLEKRGERVVQITGAVPPGIRPANLAMFQRGEARILLFTVKAGGTGLNMTAADTIVRLQRSWSMLDNKQALDRVHRIGSERHESITVVDIISPDTVEDDQLKRLYLKQMRLDEITRDKATLIAAGMDTSMLDAEEIALLGGDLLGQDELGI